MAELNTTKKALAKALKELVKTEPLSKISVGDICEHCALNRKSFYYHFKDKEDLIIWIFDSEFLELLKEPPFKTFEETVRILVKYFDENKSFYKKIIKQEGQNSFSEHLYSLCRGALSHKLKSTTTSLQIDFLTDGFVCAIKRRIIQNGSSAEEFSSQLIACILDGFSPKNVYA